MEFVVGKDYTKKEILNFFNLSSLDRITKLDNKYIILVVDEKNIDNAEHIDLEYGIVSFYTKNKFLVHIVENKLKKAIPIFVFNKITNKEFKFTGLVIPGNNRLRQFRDIEKTTFPKYPFRLLFTILDEKEIKKEWIDNITETKYFPQAFKEWVEAIKN